MTRSFKWTDFYMELATNLLTYKNKRPELIKILKEIYKVTELNFPFVEKNNEIYDDICPFTVFGAFNKGIKDSNRIALLEQFSKKFSIKAPLPDNFSGIPVLMNFNAWFFRYKESREENDINNLWDLFESAIIYADNKTNKNKSAFIKAYELIRPQKLIKWNITMGLYWIRPFDYISLDSVNREFISDNNYLPDSFINIFSNLGKNIPDAKEYLLMCQQTKAAFNEDGFPYKDFPDLSYAAWLKNQEEIKPDTPPSKKDDEPPFNSSNEINYWIYSPGTNASMWDEFYKLGIMGIGWDLLPNLKNFTSKEQIKSSLKKFYNPDYTYKNNAHCLWQFANEINVGDVIFAKKGMSKIIGKGIVKSDYIYDENRDNFKHIRKVEWQYNGEWEHPGQAAMKTLTCISSFPDYVTKLLSLFLENTGDDSIEPIDIKYTAYTKEDFLREVYIDEDSYTNLVDLLKNKLNIILQGPPGVGKTFVARRLAYSIMGKKDTSRVAMVQFHQSYSYEDFIQGYRPSKDGFELVNGVFYKFCKEAEEDNERPYFFIIDEINRGNLSKILGEMMMLLEADKRGEQIKMLYSNEWFSIPKNVHIIGMMNTADRSLAMIDYALRRRFAFFDFYPAFTSSGFENYLNENLLTKVKHNLNLFSGYFTFLIY